jgi:methylated-DNA-[protein]-cysteine S-methyltransferase
MVSTLSRSDRFRELRSTATRQESRAWIATFHTPLNWMAIVWRDEMLAGNVFGYPSRRLAELALAQMPGLPQSFCRFDADRQASAGPRWVPELIDNLQRYAEGEFVEFDEIPLSLEHLTRFGRRVVAACRRIRFGDTRSYGELAIECGSPGAARAVGSVMAKNRFPLIVPCHRVLAAGGELGGYSAPEGADMKRRLLQMERDLLP